MLTDEQIEWWKGRWWAEDGYARLYRDHPASSFSTWLTSLSAALFSSRGIQCSVD